MLPSPPGLHLWTVSIVMLVAGVTAQVSLYFLPHDTALWDRMVLAFTVGVLSGMALFRFTRTLHEQRFWQSARHLPKSIQVEQQDDGSIVAFVETLDGEPRIVTLPEGYDPREDEGRRLFELLAERD